MLRGGEKIEANRRNVIVMHEWKAWKKTEQQPAGGPSAVEPAPGGEALEAPALDGEAPAPGGEAPAPGGESPARDCQEAGEHAEAESLCQSSDKGDLFRTRLAELEWSAKTKLKNHSDHEREAEKTKMALLVRVPTTPEHPYARLHPTRTPQDRQPARRCSQRSFRQ